MSEFDGLRARYMARDDLRCWDCYVAQQLTQLEACQRHATRAQNERAQAAVNASALAPHPLLRGRR